MVHRSVIKPSLTHLGTGRSAIVLRVDRFVTAPPVSISTGKYILVVATDGAISDFTEKHARAWIDAGAAYVCAWGISADEIEEAFDYASFLPEVGPPLSYTLVTTSHVKETLEKALWFAFYCAEPPDELHHDLNTVVIVVDSTALESWCLKWVQTNRE